MSAKQRQGTGREKAGSKGSGPDAAGAAGDAPDAAAAAGDAPDAAAAADHDRDPAATDRGRGAGNPRRRLKEFQETLFSLSASGSEPGKGPRLAPPLPSSALLQAAAPMLPPVTEVRRFNTTRLLPAKYSESVLTRIAPDEDLQLIFELDDVTNDRLMAERNMRPWITARELVFGVKHARIINAAFTHPHPQGGRFSMPYRGAWYAGLELATAKAEVLFHRALHFTEIRWQQPEELDYDQYLSDMSGGFHDVRPEALAGPEDLERPSQLQSTREQAGPPAGRGTGEAAALHAVASTPLASEFAACLDPASYVASQQLAIDLLEAGSLGIVYPSTRRKGGNCIACFRPSAVANVRKRDLFRLTWYPDRAATFLRCERTPPKS